MILTVTDFGVGPPYLAQMKAAALAVAPDVPVLDLFADLPAFRAQAAAYLLAAYAGDFPPDSTFLCVVDPGVGGDRAAIVVRAQGRWFVGPDNGLLAIAARRDGDARAWTIDWRPARLSASFHGRDLFAPVAAGLARGGDVPGRPVGLDTLVGADWPDELAQIVYCDGYGNAMTGLRADRLPADARLQVAGRELPRARTFADVPPGTAFWYENANGLAEVAVNQGRACDLLGLAPGAAVGIAAQPGRGTLEPRQTPSQNGE